MLIGIYPTYLHTTLAVGNLVYEVQFFTCIEIRFIETLAFIHNLTMGTGSYRNIIFLINSKFT